MWLPYWGDRGPMFVQFGQTRATGASKLAVSHVCALIKRRQVRAHRQAALLALCAMLLRRKRLAIRTGGGSGTGCEAE